MKKTLTSLSLVIALILLMSVTIFAFSASVLSNPDYELDIDGIRYVEKATEENGKKQKLFYGEYDVNSEDAEYELVIHSIREGNVTNYTTVMNLAKDYEERTGRKVMLAVNGDYFSPVGTTQGNPVESYVNNGIVISKGNFASKHCIGFDNNGKVVIGRMEEVELRLATYDENGQPLFFEIDKFNEQPEAGEIAIYNQVGTYTVKNAGVLIARTDAANLSAYPIWGTDYTMSATGVQESKTFTLKSGQFAVVYTEEDSESFASHTFGEAVDLVQIPAGKFAGCTWVVGGYDILVNDGVVNTNCHDDNGGSSAAPRSFIGFKEDGTAFLCVVDGRQSGYSIGITVEQQAQLAGVLGAKYALELDGGGSSTMVVRVDDVLTLRNRPSDGSMRRVANAILLVEKPKADEEPIDPPVEDPDPIDPVDPTPDDSKEEVNPIVAFFRSIFEAIANFFRNLFGTKK